MQTDMSMANHLNFYRMNQTSGAVRRIPDVAYAVFKKNFETPSAKEGFTVIKQIQFMPKFDSAKDRKMFNQWTTGGR